MQDSSQDPLLPNGLASNTAHDSGVLKDQIVKLEMEYRDYKRRQEYELKKLMSSLSEKGDQIKKLKAELVEAQTNIMKITNDNSILQQEAKDRNEPKPSTTSS